ncbi:MAG: RIO1 family regulatory kinase/ATPase [Pseudomonadales bacterium]
MNESDKSHFRAGIVRGQLAEFEQAAILEHFAARVATVEARINDGKEATVYLCVTTDGGRLAAKMYRARRFRAFRNDKAYSTPLAHWGKDRRAEKAMKKATHKGRDMGQWQWVAREWRTLEVLHAAGVSVPEPVARCEAGILMEFIGSRDGAAPRLHDMLAHGSEPVRVADLQRWWTSLRDDVVNMLRVDLVHGDLSAYNVLIANGRPRIIDVPQAVDGRSPEALDLLVRDLANLTRPLQQAGLPGVHDNSTRFALELYERYRRGRL